MKRLVIILGFLGVVFMPVLAFAQEDNATSAGSFKQRIEARKQTMTEAKEKVKSGSQDAREEEKALREQIKAAVKAGDTQKADQLREQLKTMHKENVDQMQKGKKETVELKKSLKEQTRERAEIGDEQASENSKGFMKRFRERFENENQTSVQQGSGMGSGSMGSSSSKGQGRGKGGR